MAYAFALAAIALTLFMGAGSRHGIVVGMLGGTLAATPYVLVRAFEALASESVPPPRS